jgi:YegS/Rv2252/BmrU family lipid kinase
MEKTENSWGLIVNPNAGSGKCQKNWPTIQKLVKRAKLETEVVFTERKGHAIELTKAFIGKGFRKIIVVGGDGTLNEVVNGIFTHGNDPKAITLGMVPVGTGNDWCRTFNVPTKYIDAIKLIRDNKTVVQDIGLVNFHNNSSPERFFANVAGIGFDANVAHAANALKDQGKGNALSYLLILLKTLLKYNSKTMQLKIGEQAKYKERMFSLSIGIGQYNGGGMKQLPNAIANDGLLDITVIKKISKWTVIKELKNLYDGSFLNHPKIDAWQDKEISFAENKLKIETDGESVGEGPKDFSILPKALRVIGSLK